MILVPLTKRMEVIASIQVCLIWWSNFDCKENGGEKMFLAKPNTNIMYPNKKNIIVVPNHKKGRLLCKSKFVSFDRQIWFYGKCGKNNFSSQTKVSTSYILIRRTWLGYPITKKWRLLWETKFVTFDRWTLTIRKMVERKAFIAKPKCQYHVPKKENVIVVPNNKKNGDYCE